MESYVSAVRLSVLNHGPTFEADVRGPSGLWWLYIKRSAWERCKSQEAQELGLEVLIRFSKAGVRARTEHLADLEAILS